MSRAVSGDGESDSPSHSRSIGTPRKRKYAAALRPKV